jgi:hypothetical protein
VIVAEGAISDPMNPSTYPLNAGLLVLTNSDVSAFSGNTIVGAAYGIVAVTESEVQGGSDNVFQNGHTGIATFGARGPGFGRVTLGFSDFTQYAASFQGHPDDQSVLQCNYWGTSGGPSPIPDGIPPSVYTPWATAPVANGSGGACDGS